MASVRETDSTLVKPLTGACVERFQAGAAVAAGAAVYIDGSGYIQPCVATAVATNKAIGVAVQSIATGNRGDVVTSGRILCLSGATPGALVYTMDTAGEIDHTGGTKKSIVGIATSATVLLVRPQIVDFT